MADILFLAHRIPYPPNKGDKIRSWHLLAHLAKRHRVHLGCFVDDPADFAHVPFLQDLCASVIALPLDPRKAKIRALSGFIRSEALSIGYYRDARLERWVAYTAMQNRLAATVLYSSPMAQYALHRRDKLGSVIMDFVDVDSDKWRQYAESRSFPMSWVYGREARTLLAYEREIAAKVDMSFFVSDAEAALFRSLAPESAAKVAALTNAVDHAYFSPAHSFASPFDGREKALVFTGAMDYWANVDAVDWFAREVLPLIRAGEGDAVFYIVGGNPTLRVKALAEVPGVRVTGRVPDGRPYIAHAAAVVCPLRIARGIQNKVLEGMAMARPVVATPQAFEGIDATPGEQLLVADTPEAFARDVLRILREGGGMLGERARARILARYGWDAALRLLDDVISDRAGVHHS